MYASAYVASAVLLDRGLALRTFFRVRLYPIRSLGIVGTLLKPLLDNYA